MVTRRTLLSLCAAACFLPAAALADLAPPTPFTKDAFDAAMKAGGPVLVEISAPWCPICKAQKPTIAKLRADPRFKDLAAFEIDFDSDKPSVRSVGAQLQSTLLVYKGGKEVGRSVGEAQAEWIEDLFEKML